MNIFLETIIFFYVIKHQDLCQSFRSEFFSSVYIQKIFKLVKPFVLDYKESPTELQVRDLVKLNNLQDELTDDIIHQIWENESKVSQYSDDWLRQNSASFAEWQNLMIALRKVLTYIKTVENEVTFENSKEIIEKVKSIFSSETSFSVSNSKGHDFFDPSSHKVDIQDMKKSGYEFIDRCTGGGLSKKSLHIFMAAPKTGKSTLLCNLAARSIQNGENSIYITLELGYQKVMQRIGSNLFNIPIEKYKQVANDEVSLRKIMKAYREKNLMLKPGILIVEEYPTSSATVSDIESFILKKEKELSSDEKPFKFDKVYIDYVNIMKDQRNPHSENLYLKVKNICEDLRACMQRNLWIGVSVTQVNRSGYDSADFTMSSVSESSGLIATVDSLFGIIQTSMMRAQGIYYIKAIALRDADWMGYKKKFLIDKSYLRIEEDPNSEPLPDGIDVTKLENNYKEMTTNDIPKKENKIENNTSEINLFATEAQITGKDLF